ncbi:hypothetical protein [Leeuwenhoekiella marinoflava]|uniref:Uncharacterized protein n=2 Tax=Leeuwenhoekiella marinoflava TaxID=988 RepID=A0A4Q0PNM9_9FLAO|nr:hypothetical protein [Leeuwenhoekiella marinoflava]RXG32051.1 hypothetical protein DSL99_1356 [Leeuwenhoekiella marinoflava]SHE96197.1 hypothetical protein SAMN02745246_01411 [Leeuwenhoekiella marinoflava DSM 3653]
MSKKPEVKIYPDYKFGVKFPDAWTEEPINLPTANPNWYAPPRVFVDKNNPSYKALIENLNKFLQNSKGWPDDVFESILDGAKKQALYHVLKLMLDRDPEREDFEKVEELKHNQRISMMCYEGRPFAFCEWQEVKESEVPHVWITPTKYFKDE